MEGLVCLAVVMDIVFVVLMMIAAVQSMKDNDGVWPLSLLMTLLFALNAYVVWRFAEWFV